MSPALIRSTCHALPDGEAVRQHGSGEVSGPFYQRLGHQNAWDFESAVAALEGAEGAISFASGMGAISAAILAHCNAGDRVLVADQTYGGTVALSDVDLPRFGVDVERFSSLEPEELERALARPARLVMFESPINPTLRVVDIRRICDLARQGGALSIMDGTFAPAPQQRALELGLDLVVHSATKFLGGHSDVLAGVVAGSHRALEPLVGWKKRTGGVLAPDPAWLLCRSLPTHELRLAEQAQVALALAERLAAEKGSLRLRTVTHPGLPDHPDADLVRAQMAHGGCLVSFDVEGGLERALAAFDRLGVVARAPSLGGIESLASLPAFTTHAHLSPEQRAAAGIPDGLVRISVGLEGLDRIWGDLEQALSTEE